MSRYNTQVLSNIRMLCRMQNIDEKVLYERAKLILSIYREVCWSTIDRANDVCDISVDQLLFGDATESKSTARRQLDPLLDEMTEAELKIVIATAQAILDARAEEEK